ncbi:endonuclease VII domain-containing protein [Yinghuangia aomiensis]
MAKGFTVGPKVHVPPGHKRCPGCTEIKAHSEWHIKRSSSRRLRDVLQSLSGCARPGRPPSAQVRPDRRAVSGDARGPSRALCVICLVARAEHVDHDHETGRVRALLCFNCNAALGQFKDRPDALRRAAAYLEGIVWNPTRVAPGVYRVPS